MCDLCTAQCPAISLMADRRRDGGATPNHGADDMSTQPTSRSRPTWTNPGVAAALRTLEGRQVSLALADGSRHDDVTLVSAGRGRTPTLWVYMSGIDLFVPRHDVIDAWDPGSSGRCGTGATSPTSGQS